ncbi:AAA family ATPase [Bacillus luteolus]|uniref:AAA family ATPase n=1 Tax=Litchfieldia luteola TaxID=682179 RepID=A0ABR9QQ27_9BACI|nr:RNA polymerase recycling motor HelD [Cytobacillus luteolus]MBE4910615.1 AAA family ATPase [Cytobacillus luteolus]MBP1943795.1 DNA helicase-2/ATP-dependent DNA helicase PcrA [Cytobacillus luteolus]
MNVKQHPDYQDEQEWLEFTKQYMKIVIKASESDEENFRENMKDALEGIDFKDSSFRYMNMLTNSNLLRRTAEELRKLKRIQPKPYFARIDFKRAGKDTEEVLYFGKASLFDKETQKPIIVDWRSQIANLYYDGRLGEVSYEAEGGEYQGYLSLKRQYVIEDGELIDIRDIDLTTTDELLQKSLSESSSNRLSEIVATIQEEQNEIIRADLNKPIIVQGAAGSGKTTIALHRISYFIYTYADQFSPDQLMILAPNRLFIDYISEVLPELGVESILQTTFIDYVSKCIGKRMKLKHPEEKLIKFINGSEGDSVRWMSAFKGSLQFRDIIDRYLHDILQSLLPKEDLFLSKIRLYSASKISHLIVNEYKYLPYYQRVDKIKRILQNHVRTEKKRILEKVNKFYEERIESALTSHVDPDKRRSYVTKALDKKNEAISDINKESRTTVTSYMKKFPKHDLFYYYKKLTTDHELLSNYGAGILDGEQIKQFCQYNKALHREGCYEVEDLAALLYLQSELYGIEKHLRAKNVVIDEAQDYSYFQLFALRSALDTDMFTIVGDLAQGIHSYRGINDWSIVQNEIFPRSTYKTLQKSYRTTVEIMHAANDILKLLKLELPMVEPVVRHGEKPIFHYCSSSHKDTVKSIETNINKLYSEGMKTVALIGKTNKECLRLAKLVEQHTKLSVQLLKENEEINKGDVVIVSSHLSKGLEFDAVIIVALDESFDENEINVKLLYVSMTRPLHRLLFFGKNLSSFLLDRVDETLFEIIK